MSKKLKNNVAFVTGGGRGIGRETCLLLAQHGAKVAVFSDNQLESEKTVALIREHGGESLPLLGDVRSEKDIFEAVQLTKQRFGAINILVNNAGVMILKPFLETTIEDWDLVQDVNVRGGYLCTRAVLPSMLEKKEGVIINVSSIWGTKGGPDRSAYITSKHAVIGLTKALGEEMKPYNIRVNAVCPGPVDTKMMEDLAPNVNKDSWLHPRDIAHIIVDLCLPKSAAITATSIEAFGSGRPVNV